MKKNFEIYHGTSEMDYLDIALALEESQDFTHIQKVVGNKKYGIFYDNLNSSEVKIDFSKKRKNLITIYLDGDNCNQGIFNTRNKINNLTLRSLDEIN